MAGELRLAIALTKTVPKTGVEFAVDRDVPFSVHVTRNRRLLFSSPRRDCGLTFHRNAPAEGVWEDGRESDGLGFGLVLTLP
jgi:hypothetical protein